MRDPETLLEWQEAVNLADAYLRIHAARAYGLITGGPTINPERCDELLERGRLQHIHPDPRAVEQIILGGAR